MLRHNKLCLKRNFSCACFHDMRFFYLEIKCPSECCSVYYVFTRVFRTAWERYSGAVKWFCYEGGDRIVSFKIFSFLCEPGTLFGLGVETLV